MSSHCEPGDDSGGALVATGVPRVALVGAPNAGKSTLFNSLTGLRTKTGNYPGVTVGRSFGQFSLDGNDFVVEDLPGTYSLTPISIDEEIVADVLSGVRDDLDRPDLVLLVLDVTALCRSLLLAADVLRVGLPTAICLTMSDELNSRGGSINIEEFSAALGVPVVAVDARRPATVREVRTLIGQWREWSTPVLDPPEDPQEKTAWTASVLASAGYRSPSESRLTANVDRVLMHPVAGTAIFFAVMFVFFQSIFAWATPVQDAITSGFGSLSGLIHDKLGDGAFAGFLADALVGGVGTVLAFVPQIALLFVFVAILEQIGYLSRAAFLMDRVMASAGLEGRAFVAMLSSFACAIPGIMATRTMPSARERLATMLSVPLVTCSARLPVYTLLIGLFIPADSRVVGVGTRGLVLFGLYVLGAISMMVAARILTSITGRSGLLMPFTMEMPPYRIPALRSMLMAVWMPVRGFLRKVGTVILVATAILWALLNLPHPSAAEMHVAGVNTSDSSAVADYTMSHSIAAGAGKAVEPVFSPLGFDWRTNVAVISSLAARETFVASLGQMSSASDPDDPTDALRRATFESGPHKGQPVYTTPTILALLLFFVFALQCTSTLAVLQRETSTWRWPLAIFTTYFLVAWVVAYAGASIARAVI